MSIPKENELLGKKGYKALTDERKLRKELEKRNKYLEKEAQELKEKADIVEKLELIFEELWRIRSHLTGGN